MKLLTKSLSLSIGLIILASFLVLPLSMVRAEDSSGNDDMQDNLDILGMKIGLGNASPFVIIAKIIKVGLSFMGVVFLLIVLMAGFKFMISGGDEVKTAAARKSLYSAIIGTVIMLMSYSLVSLVISTIGKAAGADISEN